jgi:aminocarboxymuconate-semialdehyde decarboxylase
MSLRPGVKWQHGRDLDAEDVIARHPRLNIVLAHAGGYFPYQVGHLEHAWRMKPEAVPALSQAPST